MRSPNKALILALLMVSAGLSSRSGAADPVASSIPAAPLQQSSAVIPVESGSERSLRAEVTDVRGEVSVQTQDSQGSTPLSIGALLHTGDVVKTAQGSCRLLVDGKAQIALTPLTTLKISNESLLDLINGNIMVKLAKLKKGSTFELRTATAVATVRGTTLYLQTGQGQGPTKLYVDETHGGVDFKNILSGQTVHVPAFSLSSAFTDGKLDEPVKLTPEQKEAFFKEWQGAGGSNVSQQFGIEEITAPAPPAPPAGLPDPQNLPNLNDAQLDKLAEQNIAGANGFIAPPIAPVTPLLPGGNGTNPGPTEDELQAQEKAMIHQELADLMGDQAFDSTDAEQARVADAQTGKVFQDVHGNRVRVDEYISQPTPDTVEVLALTARTGTYQNGVSGIQFLTQFNRAIDLQQDGPLKDLPWNDYLRVIKREDLNGGDVPAAYEQFIVHEHHLDTENAPNLYPQSFTATFFAPVPPGNGATQGIIAFGEAYSDPFFVNASQGSFWVQGLDADVMVLIQSTGETIISEHSVFPVAQDIAFVNGDAVSFTENDGLQTAGFASDTHIKDLMTEAGINYYRNSNSGVHPAYLDHTYFGGNPLGDDILIGAFFPIDDQGKVFDVPGFNIRGVRDLVSPNPLVNGGKYNLELLFVFGHGDQNNFTEAFRIDALITPEIFSDFGLKDPVTGALDQSTVFPFHFESKDNT